MAILKLVPGKENAVAGTVEQVTLEPSKNPKYKDQYKIALTSGDVLYLDKDAVERQAARLQKLPNELEGETITLWKKPMESDPSKGFLNIDMGARPGLGAQRMAQAALTEDNVTRDLRTHGALAPKKDYAQVKAEYVECLADAVAIINDTNEAFELNLSGEAIMSAAATLYIQRVRAGV